MAFSQDTTPPTLELTHSWIRKENGAFVFRMLLDPVDDKGIQRLEYRERINTTSLPASMPWREAFQNGIQSPGVPWKADVPFELAFNCTSLVVQFRAVDTSGNLSTVVTRVFKSPFPLSATPSFDPKLSAASHYPGPGPLDCRGLFAADFDGNGSRDIAQLDRITGSVTVRRNFGGSFTNESVSLAANAIEDSAVADFNGDGRPDFAIVHGGTVTLYRNEPVGASEPLQFTDQTPPAALQTFSTGLTVIRHVAAADVSGDGRPDLILSGDSDDGGGGVVARVVVFHANAASGFNSPHGYSFSTGLESIRLAAGDLNGDGYADIVTLSAATRQLVILNNKGGGYFGEFNDPDASFRPTLMGTGESYFPLPAHTLALGDVTGDGRLDIVILLHAFLQDSSDPAIRRNTVLWQLFDQRQDGTLRRNALFFASRSEPASSALTFHSDVLIRDVSGDRIPEIITTNPFEDGVKVIRLLPRLNSQNDLVEFEFNEVKAATDANPHRLAVGDTSGDGLPEIFCANGAANQLSKIHAYPGTFVIKPLALSGGATTESDPEGTPDSKGLYTYEEYVGGLVTYSLSYANNTASLVSGAILECTLPKNLEIDSADAGYTLVTSGGTRYIRWVQDLPAGAAGVLRFTARIVSGSDESMIRATSYLRSGSTRITAPMPAIEVREPLRLRIFAVSDSSSVGYRTHAGEVIEYRFRVLNDSERAVSGFSLKALTPGNTTFESCSQTPVAPVLGGTVGNRTSATWSGLSVGPGSELNLFYRVRVKDSAPDFAKISNKSATLKRSDGSQVIAAPFDTKVEPPLEIVLSSSPNVARPGDIIDYTFTVKNWAGFALNNARVVNQLPEGLYMLDADTMDGSGNFISEPILGVNITPTTNPGYDPATRVLNWNLGTIPPGETRRIEFRAQVQFDLPTSYYAATTNNLPQITSLANSRYNFSGQSASTNAWFFAGPPFSKKLASKVGAPSDKLLSNIFPARQTVLTASEPLQKPALIFERLVDEIDGKIDKYTYAVIEPANGADGAFKHVLKVRNSGGATAENAVIREYLPTGAVFGGFVERNGVLVQSYFGFRFYDLNDIEIPGSGESFTDTNSNGIRDAGEPYVDANRNRKYDGISAIRRVDFPVGSLAPGQSISFAYRAYAIKLAPFDIVSRSAASTAAVTYFTVTPYKTTHLAAANMRFPVAAEPRVLTVKVIKPAHLNLPNAVIRSRGDLAQVGDSAEFWIPYEVVGGEALTLEGVKVEVDVPKGYSVDATGFINPNGTHRAAGTGESISISPPNSKGIRKVTYLMGSMPGGRSGKLSLTLAVANDADLVDSKTGYVKAPLFLRPVISGGYRLAGAQSGKAAKNGHSNPPPLISISPLAALVSTPLNLLNDSKVFVGCCAPISVKPNQRFTYTIFVGNLTGRNLGEGTISMLVPAGTKLVGKPARYSFVAPAFSGVGFYPYYPNTNGTDPAGRKVVKWDIGAFFPFEMGVVSMELEVLPTFKGSRIENSGCFFKAANAAGKTAGMIATAVQPDDWWSGISKTFQGIFSSIGAAFSPQLQQVLAPALAEMSQATGYQPCTISVGGLDHLHVRNGSIVAQIGGGVNVSGNVVGGQALVVGPSHLVGAPGSHLLHDMAGGLRIAAGNVDATGFFITGVPGFGSIQYSVRESLFNLRNPAASIVAAGAGNIVAAGAGNMVAAGAGNLIGADGSTLVGPDGASLIGMDGASVMSIASLVAAGGGNLIGADGSTLVAAGGGNIVAAGGGNIVAAGAGNLIGADGSTLVGPDGASLIGMDGASIVAAGGLNMVAAGAGNIIQRGPAQFLADDGLKLNSASTASLVKAIGGGNFVPSQAPTLLRMNP